MTEDQIKSILFNIEYKDWLFNTGKQGNGYYIQVAFTEDGKDWTGRKWYISTHATKSEVVQTALKAVLTAEEHESREKFLYYGKAIFGPHFSVDALLSIAEVQDRRK